MDVRNILSCLGENLTRDGLLDTPRRHIRYLNEFLTPKEFEFTTFEENHNEMVVVQDIDFYSLCEHHILPFFGKASIAYIPSGTIVGLSKLPRTVEMFSHRLQNQERITTQVADFINDKLNPKGVGVILKARHMCMEMRGVCKPGAITTTSAMRGVFSEDINARQEFLNLIK
jgi:GTP cyclohydrolase I